MVKPKFTWMKAGDTFEFEDLSVDRHLLFTDGFGVAPSYRFEQRGALQHGVTDTGYRLDARTLVIGISILGHDIADYYTKRRELVEMFKPDDIAGTIRAEINGHVYCIDGFVVGGVNFSAQDRQHLYQKVGIMVKCPDPTWYNPFMRTQRFDLGGGGDKFEVPMIVPFKVGASFVAGNYDINYAGDTVSFPVVQVLGPMKDFIIINETSGDKLDFTGHSLAAGRLLTIDTRYGYKTVYDDTGANLISWLSPDSDLATFSILPHPQALGGKNSFYVSGQDISATTQVEMRYYDRFVGI